MADALAECCVEVVSQAVKISIIACETEVAVGPTAKAVRSSVGYAPAIRLRRRG